MKLLSMSKLCTHVKVVTSEDKDSSNNKVSYKEKKQSFNATIS